VRAGEEGGAQANGGGQAEEGGGGSAAERAHTEAEGSLARRDAEGAGAGGQQGQECGGAEASGRDSGSAFAAAAPRTDATADPNKEVYYLGVIDILCEYGFKKQLEHSYKAAKYGQKIGAQSFSVVDPSQYSQRFQNFIEACIA
jgi:hypothetical protein